jgi:hypothetical protein
VNLPEDSLVVVLAEFIGVLEGAFAGHAFDEHFDGLTESPYERGWPSYFIIVRRRKNVGGRGVQICVLKLAANSTGCGWCIFAAPLFFFRVKKVLRLASTENIFLWAS